MDPIHDVTLTTSSIVKFKTRADHDLDNTYVGPIVGVDVTYRIASTFGDVVAYHADVPPAEGDEESPAIATLPFFLIQLPDGSIRAFAPYWIQIDSFESVTPAPDTTIIIRKLAAAKIPIIMSWIRAQGFSCAVLSST